MNIEQIKNTKSGTLNAIENGKIIGELTYFIADSNESIMIINHTWIDASCRGMGYGEALIYKAIEIANENRMQINPACTYVGIFFKQHPEYADLLA